MSETELERIRSAFGGAYRVERRLGEGPVTSAYVAAAEEGDDPVTLHVLHPELADVVDADRLVAGLRRTADLEHPNLLGLLEAGHIEGMLYYVTPDAGGDTLAHRLQRDRWLSVDDAVEIAVSLAGALELARAKSLVHGDVRPERVALESGRAELDGLGVWPALIESGLDPSVPARVEGPAAPYLSPELTDGRAPDAASDVYALGRTLQAMLTGAPDGDDDRLAKLPAHVAGALRKATEARPEDRFRTAGELAGALRDTGFRYGGSVDARLAKIEEFVTEEGRGFDTQAGNFPTLVGAVVEALDAPFESAEAARLREGLSVACRVDRVPDPGWGLCAAWARAIRDALVARAERHLRHNDDLGSARELEEMLSRFFFDEVAEGYLTEAASGAVRDPLWPYVEPRLLGEMDRLRAERRAVEPELGILLVHGIGVQEQGDTLERFGRPILERLEADATLRHATLRDTEDGAPAHAVVDFKAPKITWMMAESWWAEQFSPPPLPRVLSWLFAVGPSLGLAHLGKWFLLRLRELWRLLPRGGWRGWLGISIMALAGLVTFVMAIVASFLLTVTIQALSLLLGLVALVPSVRSRAAVARVLGFFVSVLGDSMQFADNRLVRSAILTRVRKDLAWLAERVQNVVVVAHSQGAAVAHHVLRRERPANVRLLATVGSGIGKLERADRRGWDVLRQSVVWIVPTTPILIWITPVFIGVLGDALIYLLVFYVATYVAALTAGLETSKTELSLEPVRWVDYYASHDPVPNGPLVDDEDPGWIACHEVRNYCSFLRDHNAYFDNTDQFIPMLLRDIRRSVETPALSSDLDKEASEGSRTRRRRLRWLQAHRFGTLAAVVSGTVLAGAGLVDMGREVEQIETSWLPTRGVGAVIEAVGGLAARLWVEPTFAERVGFGVTGWLALVLLIAPFFVMGRLAWSAWEGAATSPVHRAVRGDRVIDDSDVFFPMPRLMLFVGIALALAETWLFLRLDPRGWWQQGLLMLLVFPLLPFMVHTFVMVSASDWGPRMAVVAVSIAGMLWVGVRTGLDPSVGAVYPELWHSVSTLGALASEQPEAFVPLVVVLAPALVARLVLLTS